MLARIIFSRDPPRTKNPRPSRRGLRLMCLPICQPRTDAVSGGSIKTAERARTEYPHCFLEWPSSQKSADAKAVRQENKADLRTLGVTS